MRQRASAQKPPLSHAPHARSSSRRNPRSFVRDLVPGCSWKTGTRTELEHTAPSTTGRESGILGTPWPPSPDRTPDTQSLASQGVHRETGEVASKFRQPHPTPSQSPESDALFCGELSQNALTGRDVALVVAADVLQTAVDEKTRWHRSHSQYRLWPDPPVVSPSLWHRGSCRAPRDRARTVEDGRPKRLVLVD